jgi:hypothetical protein
MKLLTPLESIVRNKSGQLAIRYRCNLVVIEGDSEKLGTFRVKASIEYYARNANLRPYNFRKLALPYRGIFHTDIWTLKQLIIMALDSDQRAG